MNLTAFFKRFSSDQACRDFLSSQRWPNGNAICPHCQHEKAYKIESGRRFKCARCAKKYSCTTGTVMENSKLPLSTWLSAMYLLSSHKKGVSSIQMAAYLGITQKTAWFLIHRIRESLKEDTGIFGQKKEVEADVTWVGGKIRNHSKQKRYEYSKHRDWRKNKVPVVGIVERGGRVMLQVIKREGDEVAIIRDKTELYSTLITDDAAHYMVLRDDYYHYTVSHTLNEYGRWKFNTNTVEGMFAHLKRMYKGTYHWVSPKHMQSYLDEFLYRYNNRLLSTEEKLILACKLMGNSQRLSYKKLVNDGEGEEKRQTEAF